MFVQVADTSLGEEEKRAKAKGNLRNVSPSANHMENKSRSEKQKPPFRAVFLFVLAGPRVSS